MSRIGYHSRSFPLLPFREKKQLCCVLERDSTCTLDEVTVKAYRPMLKVDADKLIYDMSANPLRNDNALESFRYIPLLQADNQSLGILGKESTLVYINGKKTTYSRTALMAYLRTLPAGRIKVVEIMPSPNAAYGGEGNFGVINILLNRSEDEGWQGNVSAYYQQGGRPKGNADLTLLYRQGRLSMNILGGVDALAEETTSDTESTYRQTGLYTRQSLQTTRRGINGWGQLQLEYDFTSDDMLSLELQGDYTSEDTRTKGRSSFHQADTSAPYLRVASAHKQDADAGNAGVNLYYKHTFSPASFLDVEMTYLYRDKPTDLQTRMDETDEAGNSTEAYRHYDQTKDYQAHLGWMQARYYFSAGGVDFQTGINAYLPRVKDDDTYHFLSGHADSPGDAHQPNSLLKVDEYTSALFGYASRKWGQRLSTGVGVRLEYSDYDIIQHATGEKRAHDYWRLLPSLYASYHASADHLLSYALNSYMARPSYSALNPMRTYTSAVNYSTGNPDLNPCYDINQTLRYQFLRRFMLEVGYDLRFDDIRFGTRAQPDGLIEQKPVNNARYRKLNVAFSTNLTYWKDKANLNLWVNYYWAKAGDGDEADGFINNRFQFYCVNNLFLNRRQDWMLKMQLSGSSKYRDDYTVSPYWLYVECGARKVWNGWSAGIYGAINLNFYGHRTRVNDWKLTTTTSTLSQTSYMHQSNGAAVYMTLSYNFGNNKVKGVARQRNKSDVEEKL